MIIRTFQPGKMHNLYDSKKHNKFAGILIFNFDSQSNSFKVQNETKKNAESVDEIPKEDKYSKGGSEKPRTFADQFLQFAFKVDAIVIGLLKKIIAIINPILDFTVLYLESLRLWIINTITKISKLITNNNSKRSIKIYGLKSKISKKPSQI